MTAPNRKTPLRKRAERTVSQRAKTARAKKAAAANATTKTLERERLLHELEIHQVELEVQNEELRNAREIMEAALERYTEVFDFAPIGYVLLSVDGTLKQINHAGARLLGAERVRLVGRRFSQFVARQSRAVFEALVSEAIAHSLPTRGELDLLCDTSVLAARITVGVLVRGDRGVMIAFEDISDRRAKEVELARSEQALREANARKDEFLAMLSHELRNPLLPLRTSVSVLQMAPAGSEVAGDALAIIDRSAAHVARLVDDLLDITRIARGKIELQRELVELTELVRQTLGDHEYVMTQRNLRVTTTLPASPIWIYGDRARLVQVFSNVLGNAEKFTPANGQIHITLAGTGRLASLTVADTGIGIAPSVIQHVFEPFAQGPQAIDRSYSGLGLGLAMVKSIIELHGGEATIHSKGPGQGTEVTLTIPRERASLTLAAPGARQAAVPRRVLVVEDKTDSADALRYALTLKGHSVAVAHNGRTAVDLAMRFAPDVVLCDLGLPDIDGYAVARQLRGTEGLRGVCLVALSGYARPEDVARAHAAGFDRHIAKPPRLEDIDQILAAIDSDRPPPTGSALNV
jgi:two-component system, chemotaxis family, CheB/CheR fusion protein